MMRLQTYAPISFAGALAIIYHAFSTRVQFYPAMVYLSTSKISLALLLNMGGVIMYTLWKLIGRFFLGPLREAEIERLNEQTWREVMEILFTVTIFRQDLSITFFVMVTTLLAIKTLHWLAQKRVEYIETTPAVTTLSHIRIVSFLGFLLCLDGLFLYSALRNLVTTWKSSVSLFFAFEYMILATTTVATFVKYVFYVTDMLMEGEWEKRPVFTFYLELIRDLVHLSLYICFFLVIFMSYGVPLHLIRELYETFRNFKARLSDFVRYRRITSNMNDRFPDATPEELNTSDATCIICREEMVTAKKLVCGHLFHVHCLRSWLERQHTCPTCRAPVIPPENGTAAPGRHGVRSAAHQQGMNTNNASSQSSTSSAPTDGLSQHHARLQAAAAAAAMYQKSYVYPSASSSGWSQGYALLPPMHRPSPDSANVELTGERTVSGNTNFVFPRATGTNLTHVDKLISDSERYVSQLEAQVILICNHVSQLEAQVILIRNHVSQLEAQEILIRNQIEFLQNQLQNLCKQTRENMESSHTGADNKGKAVASPP